ncbi:cation diffusion facilitator family transporter [Novispirillum sp. DQ9]|uniref:cation diffusion facilitator family transporter n=1 Tax=Novispirillum sp. DQ9 TaxID=3398612 RepID=UPI003C7A96D4
MRMATYAAVAAASVLVAVKVVAWLMTDSVAMLSSLVDSMLDGIASLVNLFAVRHALQPADAEHRFGHGKAEPLAGLAQAAFVTGSGLLLAAEAVSRLLNPVPVKQGLVGIGVMAFAIVVTLALVAFQRHVIRRTNSVAITADSLHYAGDVLINLSVVVSIILSLYLGWTLADPLFGLGIAAFLLFNAWKIARESLDLLMDREFPEADRQAILDIARAHPRVDDVHDLRTRSSGTQQFIQLHLEMDRGFTLLKAHAVADQVERDIRKAFPAADVIIHQDPSGLREADHDRLAYKDRENGVPKEPLP